MARRNRLSFDTLALPPLALETKALDPSGTQALPPAARPAPIAQVAGDSAAHAALAVVMAELEEARASGRLMLRLSLDQIDEGHLARDRLSADPEEMADLIASIRSRGQQMPIEVTALGQGRFGLISGWRRMRALRHLYEQTGDARFAQVLALPRAPETMAEAYRAMIEENEIRAGISYYERARIAALAAEAGVYPDARAAIAGLFASASRAKRSKIGSFLTLWRTLDGRLRFAPAIPERLGLVLARTIEGDPGFVRRLNDRLRKAQPADAAEELALLEAALATTETPPSAPGEAAVAPAQQYDTAARDSGAPAGGPASATAPVPPSDPRPSDPRPTVHREEVCPGIFLESEGGFSRVSLRLSGPKVDGPLRARLVAWLQGKA